MVTRFRSQSQPQEKPTLPLEAIGLRKAERGLLVGGTGCGKSTLAEFLLQQFLDDYPKARLLVVDSKPRFRAAHLTTGMSARKLYRHWDHGAQLPNSMLLDFGANPNDALNNAWRHGRVALAQTDGTSQIPWSVDVIASFLAQARASRPQLIYIDEGLDFFHSNSAARGGSDAILRTARAGRERGCSLLLATQRPPGIPVQVRSELTKLYLFRLDYAEDVKGLGEMGYPYRDNPAPDDDRIFRFWDKTHRKNGAPLMKVRI